MPWSGILKAAIRFPIFLKSLSFVPGATWRERERAGGERAGGEGEGERRNFSKILFLIS